MKKTHNRSPNAKSGKPSGNGSQPNASAVRDNSTSQDSQEPTLEMLKHFYRSVHERLVPMNPPPDWTEEADKAEYISRWGESDDYWGDTVKLMERNLHELHTALSLGIRYFAYKHEPPVCVDCRGLGLRQKVGMSAELLPASADSGYTWRFTGSLVRILWLESEYERISRFQGIHRWLFPFYVVADTFLATALELNESLECEHDDYKAWLSSGKESRECPKRTGRGSR